MSSLAAIRRVLAREWTLKLSALGIAILLWFAVRFEARNQQEISSVAVRLDLSDPAWVVAEGSEPPSVSVRFRGPAMELLRLSSDRPVIVVPIAEVGSPDTTVVIQPGWVRFGERPGVLVEGISPGTVRLRFEPLQRLTLAPALRVTGELPGDLALAAPPVPTVREFRISGPRSRMAQFDSVPLRPLDLSTVTQSGAVPILVDTAQMAGLQVQPVALELQLRVESRIDRTFRLPAPDFPDPPGREGMQGYPDSVTVTISGATSLVNALPPGSLRLVPQLPDDLEELDEGFEVSFRLEGLPALLQGRVDPVPVRREDP
jgi:hypothetical protein